MAQRGWKIFVCPIAAHWLPPEVLRDAKGFALTGRDMIAAHGYARIWKERREPLPLETSVPGLFAVGELRADCIETRRPV